MIFPGKLSAAFEETLGKPPTQAPYLRVLLFGALNMMEHFKEI